MAVPDKRDHGHHRAAEVKDSSNAVVRRGQGQLPTTEVHDPPPNNNEDDDADVSDSDEDSEDDIDSDDSGDSQEEDVNSTTVQHETSVHDRPSVQTTFEANVQSASQERKTSKRAAEEDIQPEYKQSTLKKRKALQDISGSNSRMNILATAFEASEARPASAQGKTATALVQAVQQKPRAVSTSSLLRASKSGNNWPRMQDSTEFGAATLADQRIELNGYRKDLFNYVDMIQAGAIPVQFVKSFLGRLDTHISQMDAALQVVEQLHKKEKRRQTKLYNLYNDAIRDQGEAEQLISDLTLPAMYDT